MKYFIYLFDDALQLPVKTQIEGTVLKASNEIEALKKWHLFINANSGNYFKNKTYQAEKAI